MALPCRVWPSRISVGPLSVRDAVHASIAHWPFHSQTSSGFSFSCCSFRFSFWRIVPPASCMNGLAPTVVLYGSFGKLGEGGDFILGSLQQGTYYLGCYTRVPYFRKLPYVEKHLKASHRPVQVLLALCSFPRRSWIARNSYCSYRGLYNYQYYVAGS